MTYRKAILGGCFFTFVLLFGARIGRAQDEPQEPTDTKPKPAARSTPIPIIDSGNPQDDNGVEDTTNGLRPDVTPLTGLQSSTLGSPGIRHSYWVPGFQYGSNSQSNGSNQPNSSSWVVDNYLAGNISLLKAWSRSELAVNYSGGGFFSTNSTQGNGNYQVLALSQTFQWNRWLVQILDQFSYLPQSQFGFGGGTNLGVPGIAGSLGLSIPGLGGGSVPNQSIYASAGPRYSNTGVVQATYVLSARGSITASGSYGILRFVDPGNVANNSASGSLGYNYLINRHNTVGLVYRFSNYQYPGQPQALGDNIVNVAYSRKVTGRLALELYGGTEFTTFRVPPTGTQSSHLGGNASANVIYGFEHGGLSAIYFHGLTGGSGVITGSTVDQVNFEASRRLVRVWSAKINLGYAHNKAVVNSTQANFPTYNSWFAGGGISRPIGHNLNFAISYTGTYGSNQLGCSGTSCSTNQVSNYITLSFQWHTRPFVLP